MVKTISHRIADYQLYLAKNSERIMVKVLHSFNIKSKYLRVNIYRHQDKMYIVIFL